MYSGPLEDRVALRELVESYGDAMVRNDPEAMGTLWTEDALWSIPDFPQIGEVHGRAAILETWKGAMAYHPASATGIYFNVTLGSIVVEGDRANVRSYHSEHYVLDGKYKSDMVVYEDVCVRQDGKWLFKSRTNRIMYNV